MSEILRPESFYEHRHQLIYAAITDLAIQQKPIDILTVAEQLRSRGNLEEAGGPSALYTDPRNEQELRGLIESVLNEPKLAESMRSGGRENIRRFMPDVLAAHFMRVYENISRS